MPRLVVVSNRVPLPAERGPSAGGLAVVLQDAIIPGSLWFGWSGAAADETATRPQFAEADGVTYATIDLSQEDYRSFYVSFANGVLWPLFHYRPELLEFRREDHEGYRRVNDAFAAALAPLLRPDDLVWVHDYHLIPLARSLRALGARNRIGFFLHVPFVPPSVLMILPPAVELLKDMCAYDVVGFQTPDHLRDFLDCMHRLLGLQPTRDGVIRGGERATRCIATPVGINVRRFGMTARRAASGAKATRLLASLVGRDLILGIDRIDYSKGLPERFRAFARLLQERPRHRLKVSYLQVAARSRPDVRDYQALERQLDRIAGNVNGRFAEFDWVPLRYMTRPLSRNTIAGFYRMARVGLVTPMRDGMNLVAKEYVAAQDSTNPGVLILSRFAGAAMQLTDALLVNPFDPDEIAEAMDQALLMPLEERQERFAKLHEQVTSTSAETYCRSFLAALEAPPPIEIGARAATA